MQQSFTSNKSLRKQLLGTKPDHLSISQHIVILLMEALSKRSQKK